MQQVRFMPKHPDAVAPRYATERSAGADLYARTDHVIRPGQTVRVPVGVGVDMPPNLTLLVLGRSGLSTAGLECRTGVVDSDYTGEISAILHNTTDHEFTIARGDRVAQAVILRCVIAAGAQYTHAQRCGGFGSTGRT